MVNAFKYTKQLEEAGFSREQAEVQLQVISEMIEGDLATKQDLTILETGVRTDVKSLDASLKQEVALVRQDLKILEVSLMNVIDARCNSLDLKFNNLENKVQQLEYRLTIKLGTLLVIGFTTMATLLKFWLGH